MKAQSQGMQASGGLRTLMCVGCRGKLSLISFRCVCKLCASQGWSVGALRRWLLWNGGSRLSAGGGVLICLVSERSCFEVLIGRHVLQAGNDCRSAQQLYLLGRL